MVEVSIKLYGDALKKVLDIRAELEREHRKPYSITAVVEAVIYDYKDR
jgi:hypothetical protein